VRVVVHEEVSDLLDPRWKHRKRTSRTTDDAGRRVLLQLAADAGR
jgi:hypothetical protein